jgi:hypothetical protein
MERVTSIVPNRSSFIAKEYHVMRHLQTFDDSETTFSVRPLDPCRESAYHPMRLKNILGEARCWIPEDVNELGNKSCRRYSSKMKEK